MPRLDLKALQGIMLRQNYLFKHQLMNLVGISYGRLTEVIADGDDLVEEEFIRRLCNGLGCERTEIVIEE
jgi:DNA-binding Xre family transcriptional regulator